MAKIRNNDLQNTTEKYTAKQTGVKSGFPERYYIPAPLVAPVIITLLLRKREIIFNIISFNIAHLIICLRCY